MLRTFIVFLFLTPLYLQMGVFAQAKAPNIIVILADDQGWGTTSIRMDNSIEASASDFFMTPNLKSLANRSVLFRNGFASHPNCSPSRASLLTGKSPAQLHLTDIIERNKGMQYEGNFLIPPHHISNLPDEDYTLAEWIKKFRPEYSAAHFGKWHVGNGGPAKNGFDEGDGPTTNREGENNPPDDPKQIYSITQRGIDFMEKQVRADKPFYLQLSHYAVHLAMAASPESKMEVDGWKSGERHNDKLFAAMIRDLDNSLGTLFKAIEKLGIDDNTYVIYTSDNGTYPTKNPGNINGPLHGWKASVWDGGIRVPFMMAGPDIAPGRSDAPVVGYDIFPTICDLLGINDLPEGLEGGSLLPVVRDGAKKVKRPHDFLVFHFPHYQLQKGSHPATAIYDGPYKLIRFYETGETRLFDTSADISEQMDISFTHPAEVRSLDSLMTAYLKEINADLPTPNVSYDEDQDPGARYRDRKMELMNEPYFIIGK